MGLLVVECLNCGCQRCIGDDPAAGAMAAGHCPRCDYVGWATSGSLTEDERRGLRDVPLERRRRVRVHLALTARE